MSRLRGRRLAPALVGLLLAGAVIAGIRTARWWSVVLGTRVQGSVAASRVPLPTGTLAPCRGGSTCVGREQLPDPVQRLAGLVAGEHARAGCSPLQLDARLLAAAQTQASAIYWSDKISHIDEQQRTPQDRAEAAGYHGRVQEVLAVGISSAEDVMAMWLDARVDASLRDRLDDCRAVLVGVGHVPRPNNDTFGEGVWVLLLGQPESR